MLNKQRILIKALILISWPDTLTLEIRAFGLLFYTGIFSFPQATFIVVISIRHQLLRGWHGNEVTVTGAVFTHHS